MKNYLKKDIIDELYYLQNEDFSRKILKEMKKENIREKSIEFEKKITDMLKEKYINTGKKKKIIEYFNEFQMAIIDEQSLWHRMYYKHGIFVGIRLKSVIDRANNLNKNVMRNENSFFDECEDIFVDYLEKNKTKFLYKNPEYIGFYKKIKEIKEKYPNVETFLEDREAIELTDDEENALLNILDIQEQINFIEKKIAFKLGMNERLF